MLSCHEDCKSLNMYYYIHLLYDHSVYFTLTCIFDFFQNTIEKLFFHHALMTALVIAENLKQVKKQLLYCVLGKKFKIHVLLYTFFNIENVAS